MLAYPPVLAPSPSRLPHCWSCVQTSIGGGDVQFAWVPSETCVDDPFDPKWNCQQCNEFASKCLVCKAGYSFDAQNRCAKVRVPPPLLPLAATTLLQAQGVCLAQRSAQLAAAGPQPALLLFAQRAPAPSDAQAGCTARPRAQP